MRMQDERNTTDSARKKYLSFDYPLNREEQEIIDRDLNSSEFSGFKQPATEETSLPDAYSAVATYAIIEGRIHSFSLKNKKTKWITWSIAASIALLISFSFIYRNYLRPIENKQILVSTGINERLEVLLPDSSVVVLNSLSTLSYAEPFDEKKREVVLTGEGYFKVRRNESKPFIVQAGDIHVEVLGTIFNVDSYENKNTIETALLAGSVAIYPPNKDTLILQPDQIAIYDKHSHEIRIEAADLSSVSDWKEGRLVFEDCPLQEILQTLERNDHITFNIQNEQLKKIRITARFIHQETTEEILDVLGRSAGFTWEKQGRKITVKLATL